MTFIKRYTIQATLLICLVGCGGDSSQERSAVSNVAKGDCPEPEVFIKYAENNFCLASGSTQKTFILLDGTDGFPGGTKAWIKNNVFNERTMAWSDAGAEISIAHLSNRPVADLAMTKICLPKHISKINKIVDNVGQIRRSNNAVQCVIDQVADSYLDTQTEASRSVLVEAVAEVFKNPKYRFSEPDSPDGIRKFYFVSDLFQNSEVISFYKLCSKQGSEQVMTCPSYRDMVSKSQKLKRYLEAAMPSLNARDEIHIYNINISNRIDQSARKFWEQYFVEAGASLDNIFYRAELSR